MKGFFGKIKIDLSKTREIEIQHFFLFKNRIRLDQSKMPLIFFEFLGISLRWIYFSGRF
jgi:hypothetical protein